MRAVALRSGETARSRPPEQAAGALLRQGAGLAAQGQLAAAVEAFDQVVERCGDAPGAGLRQIVAMACAQQSNLREIVAGGGQTSPAGAGHSDWSSRVKRTITGWWKGAAR